jgi:hypothetical protein
MMRRRSDYFIASSICFFILTGIIFILIPITIEIKPFFVINNKSNYVQIADLFLKIELYLRGHCIIMLDNSSQCYKLSPIEMFYKFPSWNTFPSTFTPNTIMEIMVSAPTQNPYLYIPMILSILFSLISVGLGIRAWQKTLRRNIWYVVASAATLLSFAIACLSIAITVYVNIVPGELNKEITINVNGNYTVTGKLSDVGIHFGTDVGVGYVISILVLAIFALGASIRWIFEGNTLEKEIETSRIRGMSYTSNNTSQ